VIDESMAAPKANDVSRTLVRLLDLVEQSKRDLRLLRDTAVTGGTATSAGEPIANWLYAKWYSVPDPPPPPTQLEAGRDNLVSGLRAAAASSSRWERGWIVMQIGKNGSCLASRASLTRMFLPGDYANVSRPGAPVVPGDSVAVIPRLDWVDSKTSFWATQAAAGQPANPLVRVYWSVGSDHIGNVLRELVHVLDCTEAKYSLKCPIHAAEYSRVDSLVVYLEFEAWPRCLPIMQKAAKRVASHLRDSVPPLTLKIGRGVALAEDASVTQSFGQHRCAALVRGVLALIRRDNWSRKQGRSLLTESLRKAGMNPRQPWLAGK